MGINTEHGAIPPPKMFLDINFGGGFKGKHLKTTENFITTIKFYPSPSNYYYSAPMIQTKNTSVRKDGVQTWLDMFVNTRDPRRNP